MCGKLPASPSSHLVPWVAVVGIMSEGASAPTLVCCLFANRYFQRRFPRLFLTCYAFALARLTGEAAMASYFPADARQLMAPFFSDTRAPQVTPWGLQDAVMHNQHLPDEFT